MPSLPEGDNAILSKRPFGGWSCASCEKNLANVVVNQTQYEQHTSWNRMPFRDPLDPKNQKTGKGYSKMLQMLKPLDMGQSRFTADDTQQSMSVSPSVLQDSKVSIQNQY